MRRISIQLLGPFAVTLDGAPITGFTYAKVRALLAYLAATPTYPHARPALAALLWPEQPEAKARGSLSQALLTLRTALGDKEVAEPLLLADAQHVRLNPNYDLQIDAALFDASLATAQAHPHRSWRTCAACAARLHAALERYQGSFLADLSIPDSAEFEEWAAAYRAQLHQAALSGLERLVERAAWRGATAEAITYARRLVSLDPLVEESQRTLMRLLALNGETAAAVAQYRQLVLLLAQELAAEPEAATVALHERILSGDLSGLRPAPPPYPAPLPPTPLVGRRDALRALATHLDDGVRLLTILGPGGIGKTRLALEAVQELRYAFEDGVCFVELAALSDADLVLPALARALGVVERSQQALRETVGDSLRSKHLLLVLDNFEHIVAAAALVAELLAECAGLHVLVTSRAPLLVRAEHQLILDPLADSEAVQLFLQRAQAAGAPLGADADGELYAAICRRLDRLPLAIELLAVRARTVTPRELLRQLEQPLEALGRGPRDVAPRHRSLRGVIQWSYNLLTADEQRVFRALGIFAGGCTAEAAQAVVGPEVAVLPALEALHNASLLRSQVVAEQTRLLLLETIREFACEQLALYGEEAELRQRQVVHLAGFAATAYDELLRPEARRWRIWIAADYDNLCAAFRWAVEHGQYERALRLATGIWRFHSMAGSLREGLERLETALAHREHTPLAAQCDALRAAGTLATSLNDYARARRWLEAAVEAAWRLGDTYALQTALQKLGTALLEQGELDDARTSLEVSLALARRGEDPTLAKFPLGYLAQLHRRLGELTEARALSEECLQMNQLRQDPEGIANALITLGTVVLAQGEPRHAYELAQTALEMHRTLDHQLGMGLAWALLGDIAQAEGDDDGALNAYRRCLELWRERENAVTIATVVDRIAAVCQRTGDRRRGVLLAGATAAIRERFGVRLSAAEQTCIDAFVDESRVALSAGTWGADWSAGRTLTLAQLVATALAEDESGRSRA